ncbi:TPA: hypothetical protein LU109_003616 [Enterobacter hormaechei subsp. xiangfangensis]|nr:hypothetical protein [Enterobacter hormaechei subsp. xiangfangensis]
MKKTIFALVAIAASLGAQASELCDSPLSQRGYALASQYAVYQSDKALFDSDMAQLCEKGLEYYRKGLAEQTVWQLLDVESQKIMNAHYAEWQIYPETFTGMKGLIYLAGYAGYKGIKQPDMNDPGMANVLSADNAADANRRAAAAAKQKAADAARKEKERRYSTQGKTRLAPPISQEKLRQVDELFNDLQSGKRGSE